MAAVVHNEALHAAAAVKAFNDHAVSCIHCADPARSYELGQALCTIGIALSGELRNAFRFQEKKLESDWPSTYKSMDVVLPGAKGPSAGVVVVMNMRRTRRIMDEMRDRAAREQSLASQPIKIPYLEIANSRHPRISAHHTRTPSDISTRSDDDPRSTTYYRPATRYTASSFPPSGRSPRGPNGSPQVYYEPGVTQQRARDRDAERRRRSVRFE